MSQSKNRSRQSSRLVQEDPVVRTGSALYDDSVDTVRQSDESRVSPLYRLEEICGKLRVRIAEVESSETKYRQECARLQTDVQAQSDSVSALKDRCSHQESLVTEYQAENARLLSKLNAAAVRPPLVSQETSAVISTDSRSVDADMQCNRCSSLTQQVERYRHSASEAQDLGEQLSVVADERDRLKNDLKRLNQTNERVKIVLKENDRLKEALKKRFPSNFSQLVGDSSCLPNAAADRVRELELKLERSEEQSAREVEALRARHEQIRDDYERTIRSMRNTPTHAPLRAADHSVVPAVNDETMRENEVLKRRVKDLEARVESVKQFYQLKQRKQLPSLGDHVANPPVGEREVTLSEWTQILEECLRGRARADIESDLVDSDYRKAGLVDRHTFIRALGCAISQSSARTLVLTYSAKEDQVAYKSFLSDLAVRDGVSLRDIETENSTLRGHVNSLMQELEDRIEAAESGQLAETLEHATKELAKKDNELRMYKTELNRFIVGNRNMRRVSLGE